MCYTRKRWSRSWESDPEFPAYQAGDLPLAYIGEKNGAGDRHRTCDLPLTGRLLCQLSYTGKEWWIREELNLLLPRCERGGLPMTYGPMIGDRGGDYGESDSGHTGHNRALYH